MTSEEEVTGCSDRQIFIELLKGHSIILQRGMTPALIKKKEKAWIEFHTEFMKKTAKEIDMSKLKKKLNNIKTEIKRKTDKKHTGNKQIKLSEWEKDLLDLLAYEENPEFAKVPGAIAVDTYEHENREKHISNNSVISQNKEQKPVSVKENLTASKKILEEAETEKTKVLSTPELQRLVLLEQLKVAHLQIQKTKLELELLQKQTEQPVFATSDQVFLNVIENAEQTE